MNSTTKPKKIITVPLKPKYRRKIAKINPEEANKKKIKPLKISQKEFFMYTNSFLIQEITKDIINNQSFLNNI